MSNYLNILMFFVLIMFMGCEDVELATPGNNQSNESVAPVGTIIWDENNVVLDNEKATLPENSAAGITIGRLNATDDNPDDEFDFQIKSQKVDGSSVNYFTIEKDSESNYDLETNSNNIDYESLTGSKEVTITITVNDDNPDQKTSDFDVVIEIINVNEAPFWANANGVELANYQPSITSDINIPYEGTLYWDDEDDDQNPTLTVSTEKPGWLDIDITGTTATMAGTPDWNNNDIGTGSFLMTISDGEFDVPVDMNFEVRPNQRPYLQSFLPTHSFRVGCHEISDEILTYIAKDLDNYLNGFNGGNEYDLLTVDYNEDIGWLTIDISNNNTKAPNLLLRCVSTPTNDDAQSEAQQITFTITDNRESVPQDTTYNLAMTLLENHEPEFSNTDEIPNTIPSDTTTLWTVQWQDADEDLIRFTIDNPPFWISYDQSNGEVSALPTAVQAGQYELIYWIEEDNDGCYSQSFTHYLTVE